MRSLEKPKEIALVRHRLAGLFSIKGSLRGAYSFPSLIKLASMSDCEAECPTMGRHSHHLPEGKDRSHSGRRSLAWCGDVSSIWKKENWLAKLLCFVVWHHKYLFSIIWGSRGFQMYLERGWDPLPWRRHALPVIMRDLGWVTLWIDKDLRTESFLFFFKQCQEGTRKNWTNSYIQRSQSICWWIKTSGGWQRE